MKTIIIWDNLGIDPIRFITLDGDYSHLNQIYLNRDSSELEAELFRVIDDVEFEDLFPIEITRDHDTKVITCGYLY